ncbi:Hormone-sensitive lipase [Balamuthia mandrillaris]
MNSTGEKQMWESGELSLAEQQEIEQELASLEAGEKHQHQQENCNAAATTKDEATNVDLVAEVTSNAAEEEEEEDEEEKKKEEREDEVQWEVLPERDMELSFRDDGKKEEEAHAEQRQRVQRQLAQVSFLEKRLQRTLIDTLVLAAVARAMWEETHTAAHGMEGREYHLLVSSVLNGLREHVESLIERQVPEQKQLGLLALGGYRSLLLVTQECLSHAHSILSVYTRSRVHSPVNNTPALSVEDKASKEHERAKGAHSLSTSPQAEAPISASLSTSRDRKKLTSSAPSVPTLDAPPRHKSSADPVSSPSGSSTNSNNSASTPPFSFASSISSAFSSAFSTTSATTPRRKSHTTTTEPDKWISSPATSLAQLKEEMEGTLSLLQQLVHIFKICNVIPLDAEKYFSLTLDEIENMFPDSLEWKLDMFPHYVGFEYSKELMQYVRLLDVFYIASTKAYNATNPLTKKTIFSSSVVKYNVLPKEAAVLATNCKKNLSREVLISVWELLEDQVFRWLAVNSGFFPKVKITVNSRITIPFPSSSSPSSSPSFSSSSAASVASPDEQKKSNSPSTDEEVPVIHARFFWHRPKKRASTLSASPTTNATAETSEKAGKPTTAESRFGSFMSYVSQQWSKEEKQHPTKQGATTTENLNHNNNVEETQKVMQEQATSAPKKKEKQNEEGGDGQEPAFLILHIHGGGFISQTSNSHSMYLKQWAHDLGIPIVSIDYTKAPAGHYPIPLTECYTAYKWLQTNYHQLGIPHNPLGIRILLAGDSAGGNLCAALTLKALEEDKVLPPIGTILFYPAVTLTATGGISRLAFCHDPILNYRTLMLCQEAYLSPVQQEAAAMDYFISPGVAPNYLLAQFPPTFVILGGIDPLLDDGLLFAQRLRENGRQVTIKLFDTLPHGFLNLSQAIPSAQKAVSYTTACFRHLIRNFLEASKDPWNSKDIASSSSSSSVSSSSLPA